jgi:leucyl/phenylalanyl-tRNA--protein transferase
VNGTITPEMLLRAYACGVFPMAESRNDQEVHWIDPRRRGVLPLDGFHLPHRLARTIRQNRFEIRVDSDFEGVLEGCAEPKPGRDDTWINPIILRLMRQLFERGYAHSVECWRQGKLVGGLYGVAISGAFFGESMFSRERDASKVALVHLVLRLKLGGFRLLDTQFVTEHLKQFGTMEIERAEFHSLLEKSLAHAADFRRLPADASPQQVLDLIEWKRA